MSNKISVREIAGCDTPLCNIPTPAGAGNGIPTGVSVGAPPKLDFSKLTEGQAMLELKIREAQIAQAVATKNKNPEAMSSTAAWLQELRSVKSKGLHSNSLVASNLPHTSNLVAMLAAQTQPAVTGYVAPARGISGDPTPQQIFGCWVAAAQKMGNLAKWWRGTNTNGQDDAVWYHGVSGVNNAHSLNVFLDKTLYFPDSKRFLKNNATNRRKKGWSHAIKYFNSLVTACLNKVAIQNVISEKTEGSGMALLYHFNARDTVYNNRVEAKQIAADTWISSAADITGLSRDVIRQMASNGILAQTEDYPQTITNKLRIAMGGKTTGVGEPITIGTIILIVSAITALIKAAAVLITAISGDIKQLTNQTEIALPPADALKAVCSDFEQDGKTFALGPNGECVQGNAPTGGSGKSWLPLALAAAGAYFILGKD